MLNISGVWLLEAAKKNAIFIFLFNPAYSFNSNSNFKSFGLTEVVAISITNFDA